MAIVEQQYGQFISRETIEAIVRTIAERFEPEKIILFGSYAGGQPTPDSDLDFLIIMNTDLPRHKRPTPLRLLFNPAPCSVDFLVFTPQEVAKWNGTVNHIVTEALTNGKVVYERQQ